MAAIPAITGKDKIQDEEKRMELHEHLGELRSRIMRCLIYLIIGSGVCYYLFERIYAFLFRPMYHAMEKTKVEWHIVFTHFPDAFFVVFEVSLVAGVILMAPFIIIELYMFIAPALTKDEKKPIRYVAPLSIVLFVLGVLLAYFTAPLAIGWFVDYVRLFPHGILNQDPKKYVLFVLKMMGIFGAVFQLPVLLMFLAWVGLLKAAAMRRTWRQAIVGITFVGMVITPSNDVFTMIIMTIPVVVLYIASIWLVAIIEKKREKKLRDKEQ